MILQYTSLFSFLKLYHRYTCNCSTVIEYTVQDIKRFTHGSQRNNVKLKVITIVITIVVALTITNTIAWNL